MLARVNSIREEPGGTGRLFVTDMNGPIYILDKKTKALTTYLDFNGSGDRPGLFDRLLHDPGYSSGISQFQFDPDYRRNGKFYTVHMESPALPGSQRPDTTKLPGLTFGPFGYEPTAAVGDARADHLRVGAHRVDRHQPAEHHVRGHGARSAARAAEPPHSSDGRGGVSSRPRAAAIRNGA